MAIQYPDNPTTGDRFTDPTSQIEFICLDDTVGDVQWGEINKEGAAVSDTVPASPFDGLVWFDSTTGITRTWYVDDDGGQWMQDSTVDGANQLPDNSVSTAKLQDDAVTSAKIADANVTNTKLASNSVSTVKIANIAVTTAKIADANVTSTKLASNSVSTVKIIDANVTTDKIANIAVTSAKIADANVTSAKIADANVTTVKLENSAVTSLKMNVAELQLAGLLPTAWVKFSTTGNMQSSYNVSSVTRVQIGEYIVNFAVPMDDEFYTVVGSLMKSNTGGNEASIQFRDNLAGSIGLRTGTFGTGITNNFVDSPVSVVVFGGKT